MVKHCSPTVVMIVDWLRREYNADVEIISEGPNGSCVLAIITDGLPDKEIVMNCEELVPGVVIINVQ